MRNAFRSHMHLLFVYAIAVLLFIATGTALAQQRQKVAVKAAAENTKYTQRHTLDTGEPGRSIGLFEIHRMFPVDPPVINGVKVKESFSRGYSDYIDRNGLSVNYITYVFDNGDRMYVTTRTMGQADSAGKRTTISVGEITGGTGKFVGIKGISRATGISQGQAGLNESQTELEYWFVK
jgi:hypothetical protein